MTPIEDQELGIFDNLKGGRVQEPVKREKTFGHGACPTCSSEKVGLVRSSDGRHLVWRVHYLKTHAGTSLPCRTSAQYLCASPARHIEGYDTPLCPHNKKRILL